MIALFGYRLYRDIKVAIWVCYYKQSKPGYICTLASVPPPFDIYTTNFSQPSYALEAIHLLIDDLYETHSFFKSYVN